MENGQADIWNLENKMRENLRKKIWKNMWKEEMEKRREINMGKKLVENVDRDLSS